jgi:hypothetical protein
MAALAMLPNQAADLGLSLIKLESQLRSIALGSRRPSGPSSIACSRRPPPTAERCRMRDELFQKAAEELLQGAVEDGATPSGAYSPGRGTPSTVRAVKRRAIGSFRLSTERPGPSLKCPELGASGESGSIPLRRGRRWTRASMGLSRCADPSGSHRTGAYADSASARAPSTPALAPSPGLVTKPEMRSPSNGAPKYPLINATILR